MASGGHTLLAQKPAIEAKIKTLYNTDLKEICKAYSYAVSGTKALLQGRCFEILDDLIRRGDATGVENFKHRMNRRGYLWRDDEITPPYPSPATQPYNMAPQRGGGGLSQNSLPPNGKFKSSPFYEVLDTLLPLQDLPETASEMPHNRHHVRSNFTIPEHHSNSLRKESNLRILLYCGAYDRNSPFNPIEVAFPGQIEVKVNDNEVKANFKGLKNKSGSTKPADITSVVRKFSGQQNTIQVTYALTNRRFAFLIYLVRHVNATELTERIKQRGIIRKQKVLEAMARANADPDISATSIRMSLKDPVSTMRITLPVRSSHCTHNQCFDGAMFLQLQEQAPQWSCPVCSKTVAFDSLCVDEYFQEILNKTPKSIEKVDVEPTGEWRVIKEEDDEQANGTSSKNARASYDDDFDDDLELVEQPSSKQVNGVKNQSVQPSMPSPLDGQSFNFSAPPLASREPSVAQSAAPAQRSSSKRPQDGVIDLTLSDEDDDDQPPRPAKRQATTNNRNSNNHTKSYNIPNSSTEIPYHPTYNPRPVSSYRPPSNLESTAQPNFNAPSMSPPAATVSPATFSQAGWSAMPPSRPAMQQNHSSSSNYSIGPGGNYAPTSPFVIRAPQPQDTQDGNYTPYQGQQSTGYDANGYVLGHGGLRLPPMNAASPQGQGAYQGGWRSDYDYGSYSQSPG